MKQRKRLPRKRATPRVVHSERTAHITGHARIRLHGKARSERRQQVFERAGGRCEEFVPATWRDIAAKLLGVDYMAVRCPNRATEWSHRRHGANKCDCLDPRCSIASCAECHKKIHGLKSGKAEILKQGAISA